MTKEIISFRQNLLDWYRKYRRDLPWRRTRDPYAIWVSEVMLQQTQVTTVIPYYERFLKKFPTIKMLAKAPESEVLGLWSGLGYYRRARFLHRGAQWIVANHSGQLPPQPVNLQKIPGIGAYTAAAIASIAFNFPVPLVDGNVVRVFSRLFAKKGHRKDPQLHRGIWALAQEYVDPNHPGDFNQALMELGATVCRSPFPQCERCPVEKFCDARRLGCPEDFPDPAPREKTISLTRIAGVCWQNQRLLLVQPHTSRWFQGMWSLPHDYIAEIDDGKSMLHRFLNTELKLSIAQAIPLASTKHSITHHRITTLAWQCQVKGKLRPSSQFAAAQFFSISEIKNLGLANLDRKVLQKLEV